MLMESGLLVYGMQEVRSHCETQVHEQPYLVSGQRKTTVSLGKTIIVSCRSTCCGTQIAVTLRGRLRVAVLLDVLLFTLQETQSRGATVKEHANLNMLGQIVAWLQLVSCC